MNSSQSIWHGAAWLALSGMCIPSSLAIGNEVAPSSRMATRQAQPTSAIHDVALGPGGLLVGQIVDESMQPMREAAVAIQVDGQTTAATTTDANGVFAVSGLRGGLHQIATGDAIENCRLWAPGTAPPRAESSLRFIPGRGDIVRGQWGPPPSYDSMMAHAKAWATNPWVIGGVVATAIAVPVLLHNLDDEDNGS
ncbi:MAG: hypothetical protein WD738_12600 [Pirellulales bacterium]